jgi:hypothetical protein
VLIAADSILSGCIAAKNTMFVFAEDVIALFAKKKIITIMNKNYKYIFTL